MSELKCPFCQQDLCKFGKIEKDHTRTIQGAYCPHCKIKDSDIKLWQELIRTRKALDVAVDALKDNLSQANFTQMLDASRFHCIRTRCESALAEITALEQKEHFADASKKIEQKD